MKYKDKGNSTIGSARIEAVENASQKYDRPGKVLQIRKIKMTYQDV